MGTRHGILETGPSEISALLGIARRVLYGGRPTSNPQNAELPSRRKLETVATRRRYLPAPVYLDLDSKIESQTGP